MFSLVLHCIATLRSDIIAYRFQPVLFNRASKEIHVFVDEGVTWWKLWEFRPPSRIDTWNWSCARAEIVEFHILGGGGVPRAEYALVCAVTSEPGGKTAVARFGVGLTCSYHGNSMVERWEHIRRFMDEGGPHLAPGDAMFLDESTQKFWSILTWGQPLLGPGSKIYWTGEVLNGAWYFTIPAGLFFLLLLPLTVIASVMRWLSHIAKREPRWTVEILSSVGGRTLGTDELIASQVEAAERVVTTST